MNPMLNPNPGMVVSPQALPSAMQRVIQPRRRVALKGKNTAGNVKVTRRNVRVKGRPATGVGNLASGPVAIA